MNPKILVLAVMATVLPTAAMANLTPNNDGKFTYVATEKATHASRGHRGHRTKVAKARRHETRSHRDRRPADANGSPVTRHGMVTVETVYGFTITVNPAYADKFLKFFTLLKAKDYKINPDLVGCYALGGHVRGSNHYIGAACDIQTGWNRGPSFVYHMEDEIKQAGLYSGCSFHDCGHVEAVRGTHNRPPPLIAGLEKFKAMQSTAHYQP